MGDNLDGFQYHYDNVQSNYDIKSYQFLPTDDSKQQLGFINKKLDCKFENESKTLFGVLMIIMVVIGLVGNLLVFSIIVILREYKKSVTNWYILQLTLADTLFLLMLPFTAQSEITGRWDFSEHLCKFKEAVIFINYYASIYFLVVMSFDRYLAITKTFTSTKWQNRLESLRSPISSYIFSVVGWILSVLLCIQLFQYSSVTFCKICQYSFPKNYSSYKDVEDFVDKESHDDVLNFYFNQNDGIEEANSTQPDDAHKCSFETDSYPFRVWIYGNFIGAFCLPFLLICFFYGMILKTILKAGRVGNVDRQRAYRKRVTMMVLALVTLFLISWLPWYTEKLSRINGNGLSRRACRNFESSVRLLSYLNSALNPYFYSFLGAHFRERLKKASTRVGLHKLPSRPPSGSFIRRHKRSTSNSGGSVKPGSRNQYASVQNGASSVHFQNRYENDDPKFSVAQKTERTLV